MTDWTEYGITPYWSDNLRAICKGDCRSMELPDECVQCVVTSPPYWGLRKYSGEQELIWGGKDCEHRWADRKYLMHSGRGDAPKSGKYSTQEPIPDMPMLDNTCSLCGAWKGAYGLEPSPELYIQHTVEILREIRRVLRKDGVVLWNIGDSYFASGGAGGDYNTGGLREGQPRYKQGNGKTRYNLKPKDLCLIPFRVALAAQEPYQEFTIKELSDRAWLAGIIDADGCIGIHHYDRGTYHQFNPFVSVGCSDETMVSRCATITRCNGSRQVNRPHYEWRLEGGNAAKILEDIYPYLIVKEKQARVAHALWRNIQDTKELHKGRGHKTPDSVVRDRIALWELIKKCNQREDVDVNLPPVPQHIEPGWWVRSVIIWSKNNPMPESVTDRPTGSHEYILMLTKSARYYWDADAVREPALPDSYRTYRPMTSGAMAQESHFTDGQPQGRTCGVSEGGRNIRSVWEFPTQPYPEAHFAVFPEKLPEICIKAATPEVGCCSKCGAPWVRVTKVIGKQVTEAMKVAGCKTDGTYNGQDLADYGSAKAQSPSDTKRRILENMSQVKEYNWQPTCKCNADKVPSLCLDPFMGSGTVLEVAAYLGRKSVGYDTSKEYCDLAIKRNNQTVMELKV